MQYAVGDVNHHDRYKILTAFVLWGCGSPQKKDPEPTTEPTAEQQPAPEPAVSSTLPASQFSNLFNSAEQSLARFDWMQASVTLLEIPAGTLSRDDRAYLAYLQARIAYIHDQHIIHNQRRAGEMPGWQLISHGFV